MEETIDHGHKKGKQYEPKPPATRETRLLQSEKMKEFNRRTGKVTATGDRFVRRTRKPKWG